MKEYFYAVRKEQFGPFTFEELKDKKITKDTLVWYEGLENWTKARFIEELSGIIKTKAIPPPLPEEPAEEVQQTQEKSQTRKVQKVNKIFEDLQVLVVPKEQEEHKVPEEPKEPEESKVSKESTSSVQQELLPTEEEIKKKDKNHFYIGIIAAILIICCPIALFIKYSVFNKNKDSNKHVTTAFVVTDSLSSIKNSSAKNGNIITSDSVNKSFTVTDYDGNVYHTVTIGKQLWMVENLKVTHYRDGTPIPNVTDKNKWSKLSTGAYCNYDNNDKYVNTYGRLYNWYALKNSHSICPAGWHVPSDADWTILTDFLGGKYTSADKLKKEGTAYWKSPNAGANNSSGFTALPGGYRGNDGVFDKIGYYGYWWTATENNTIDAWFRGMYYNYACVYSDYYGYSKGGGFSVRCLKD
ncbi:MAG: DUF4339 domain-containing protein [Bacteroidetes bacterium]|nr:DUF4339 domain-containing protein [Bacteroidota bacterium]